MRKPLPGIRKRRASADADASAGLPEIPEGASSAWPQEETLPAPPLAVSLRPPSILLPGRKKSRKKNGP